MMDELYLQACELEGAELEARIKGPILHRASVSRLLNYYDNWDFTTYQEKRSKIIGVMGAIYRSINDDDIILKTKIATLKFRDDWHSIVLSTEEHVRDMTLVSRYFSPSTKHRWSKKIGKNTVRLDITYIVDENIYQVELELLRFGKDRYKKRLLREIRNVIGVLQDSSEYISRKRFELVREIVDSGVYPICVSKHKYQKPLTMNKKHIIEVLSGKTLFMTVKKDGLRMFLVIFNGMVYSVDTTSHVRLLYKGLNSYTSPEYYILDTELVGDTYYAFDIVSKESLTARMELLMTVIGYIQNQVRIVIKEYTPLPDRDRAQVISRYWFTAKDADGIIFIDPNADYMNNVWKWKPNVTVDLMIDDDNNLYAGGKASPLDLILVGDLPKSIIHNVFEMEILGDNKVRALRSRDDKEKPNSYHVVEANIRAHSLRHVWEDTKGCYNMRRYHDQVKKELIRGGNKDNPVTTLFFCLNLEQKLPDKMSQKVVGIFMDGTKIPNNSISTARYTIVPDGNSYYITINGTHVSHKEQKVYLSQVEAMFAKRGYKLSSTKFLADRSLMQKYGLSREEMELSSMFRSFVFSHT